MILACVFQLIGLKATDRVTPVNPSPGPTDTYQLGIISKRGGVERLLGFGEDQPTSGIWPRHGLPVEEPVLR